MPLYEHVYLARQDLSAQQVEEMTTSFKGVVEGLGGKLVGDPEYWGVKTLSFRIRKNRKAHFTLFKLDAPPAALTEVERQERLSEDVLRYLTVRVDEPLDNTVRFGAVEDVIHDAQQHECDRLGEIQRVGNTFKDQLGIANVGMKIIRFSLESAGKQSTRVDQHHRIIVDVDDAALSRVGLSNLMSIVRSR